MPLFNYVDKTGNMKQVDAADSTTALKSAPDIAPNSGVQLYRSAQNGIPSPYQAPTTGTTTPATPPTPAKPSREDAVLSSVTSSYNNPSELDLLKKKITDTFSSTQAPDQASILKQKQDAAQALINEINAQYAIKTNSAKVDNAGREARVRALSSNSGLGGSNVGASKAQEAADQSSKNLGMIDDERNAKINTILTGIDSQASEEFAKRRAAYLAEIEGNYDKINEFQTAERSLAKTNLAALASNGVTLSSLQTKAPDTYKALLTQSGLDPVVFAAVYNASLPENQKMTYSYQKIGNNLYAIHTDPATNKIVTEKINTPEDGNTYDQFMIAPDGTPLFIDKLSGKVTEASGNYAKNPAPGDTSSGTYPAGITTAAQKNEYDQGLNFLRRQPDYVSTDENVYKNDPVARAFVIKKAKDEIAASK